MRVFANQLCAVFCTESDFSSEMVREYGGNFYEKTSFFWDPLVVPFLLERIFEDPQKSSMIFYRKDLTAKIMLRTHMLFLKLQYFVHTRTHAQTSIFRRFPHNSPKGAIIMESERCYNLFHSLQAHIASHHLSRNFYTNLV